MSTSKKNPNSNPSCFSTFFKLLTCSTNLPTYPDHDHDHDHQSITAHKISESNDESQLVEVEDRAEIKPGIVARLMGLESMPEKITPNHDALFFRCKSLNSLHFFPDFDSNPNKSSAVQRRAATSATSSHLGSSFSFKIGDEEVDSSKVKKSHNNEGGLQQGKKQGRRVKVAEENFKRKERRRKGKENVGRRTRKYEEGYRVLRDKKSGLLKQNNSKGKLGVNNVVLKVSSKRRVHKKEDDNLIDHEVSSDSVPRSPVCVLDLHHHHHQHHLDYSPSKDDKSQQISSSRRKPTPKNKIKNQNEVHPENIIPQESKKDEDEGSTRMDDRKLHNNYNYNCRLKKADDEDKAEMIDFFVGLLGKICRLSEEHVRDPNWVAKSQWFKTHFLEELSLDFGGQILHLLLNEILDELLLI